MKKETIVEELVKATPADSLSGAVFLGVPLADWVFALGGILLLLQLFFLLRDKVWRDNQRERFERKVDDDK